MIFRLVITCYILCFSLPLSAANNYPVLWDRKDPQLQQSLESMVNKIGLMPHIKSKRLSLVLVDITDIYNPRVAELGGDKMIYAASLPKIAILLGAFVQVEQNKLILDDALSKDMTKMIRHSDNAAATRVLERVGREELLGIIQSLRYRLYDPERGGGLWVGKDYAKKGAYHRDPLKNISHGATAMQVARFYYLLETNRLVGPELTREMKQILSKPAITHKFVKGLKSIPGAKVYRKSGTWGEYHADGALVESAGHTFIIVGLAQHPQGGQWLSQLAAPLHDLIVNDRPAK
jgi:beta-lactamase class A